MHSDVCSFFQTITACPSDAAARQHSASLPSFGVPFPCFFAYKLTFYTAIFPILVDLDVTMCQPVRGRMYPGKLTCGA